MGQNKVIEVFFEEPNRVFQIRELSRSIKVPKSTVVRKLNELKKQNLIQKRAKGFIANESYSKYRVMKKLLFLDKIYNSGLIPYLEEQFNPRCIILFGSFSKGEYHKESDIDIFIQSKEGECNLKKIERFLKHRIHPIFYDKFSDIGDELFNNIINGIKLSGYIKLRWKKS